MDDIMIMFKQSQEHILAVQDAVHQQARQLNEKVGMDFGDWLDELAKEFGIDDFQSSIVT